MTIKKSKEAMKHLWKHHKLSTIQYLLILAVFLALLFLGATLIREKIALPTYELSGLVLFALSFNFYLVLSQQAHSYYEEEEKKEKLNETKEMQKP